MKKKTGLILAAVGAGAGFLTGRFVERIVTVKSLVDRIEDIGGGQTTLKIIFMTVMEKITEKMKTNSMKRMMTLTMRKTRTTKTRLRQ